MAIVELHRNRCGERVKQSPAKKVHGFNVSGGIRSPRSGAAVGTERPADAVAGNRDAACWEANSSFQDFIVLRDARPCNALLGCSGLVPSKVARLRLRAVDALADVNRLEELALQVEHASSSQEMLGLPAPAGLTMANTFRMAGPLSESLIDVISNGR
jgi:hypothetical protein